MALLRALLLERRIPASEEYEAILPNAREALNGLSEDKATWEPRLPLASAAYGAIQAFVRRWLSDCDYVVGTVMAVVVVDARGIDVLAVDAERAHHSATWNLTYGSPTTALGRQEKRDFRRKLTKHLGWRRLDDVALLERATVWVAAHHVFNSLTYAIKQRYGVPRADYYDSERDVYDVGRDNQWTKALKPFDDVLGIKRRPGRWPASL